MVSIFDTTANVHEAPDSAVANTGFLMEQFNTDFFTANRNLKPRPDDTQANAKRWQHNNMTT